MTSTYTVKTRKATVVKTEQTFTPTSFVARETYGSTLIERWEFTRKDGAQFTVEEFEGTYACRTRTSRVLMDNYEAVQEWCRRHSLPSLDYIEAEINQIKELEYDDPMGHPSLYI